MQHVTRIAPSPTGMFHLGTARTALFNWLAARASGGKFILRIDDTDISRHSEEAVGIIFEAMNWLGLDHDLTFRQSERLDRYREVAQRLLDVGCAVRDGEAIRFTPQSFPESWTDTTVGPVVLTSKDHDSINGLVIMRSDGLPTYHFASVVDDMDYGVTWVIRGQDHVSNTAKHVCLWGFIAKHNIIDTPPPLWSHIGLIMHQKKKLSKREGAASVLNYREQGVDPDALVNWMLRLGWGPTREDRSHRIIDRQRAVDLFLSAGNMRPAPSNMDPALLAFLDRNYKAQKKKVAA